MNHINFMAAASQLIGEALYKNSISPKIIGRVEGRDHTKAKGSIDHDKYL
jgi:hypothetical protein